MALPVITNTVRLAASGDGAVGSNWANVMHFRHTGGAPSAADITALVAVVDNLYQGPALGAGGHWWAEYASTLANLTKIAVTPLDGATSTTTTTYAVGGAQAGDPLPGGVALCVTFRTALRGRSYRGRAYLAALSEAVNASPGIPTNTMQAGLLLNYQALPAALTAVSWEHVVASYLHSTAQLVTSYAIDQVWDSQRRRNAA